MKSTPQRKPPRASIYLNDDDQAALNTIKAYYGISSTAIALRRALAEHAKSIASPVKQVAPIVYRQRQGEQ